MRPDLKTLTGDLLGQLLSTTLNSTNSTLLTALGSNLKFIDASKINLNNLKAAITFKDGMVSVKPFDINYKDIKATIGGTHGFDQSMNYNIKFDVPAKYLGTEATALIAKLTPAEAVKLESIPVNASVTGNFTNPKISTDIKTAVTNLTNQLVQQQKERLLNQGNSALNDFITKNKKPSDTVQAATPATKEAVKAQAEEQIKTKATNLLNGLFKQPKKAIDTTKAN
jgi:hypothetical protein